MASGNSNDKDYGKIQTQFESIKMAPAPGASDKPGGQHNPGVTKALNEAPTEGKVKTVWYYTPQGPAPSIQGKNPLTNLDSTFDDMKKSGINADWNPPDSGRPKGTGSMETAMGNPFAMDLGQGGAQQYAPTPPGDSNDYGGGQASGSGTPPGDPMEYGGGQS